MLYFSAGQFSCWVQPKNAGKFQHRRYTLTLVTVTIRKPFFFILFFLFVKRVWKYLFYYLLDFGMAKVVYRDIKGSGKRKINIECRLSPKLIENVKTVSAFFIFYQPLSNISQARHLLVGFSQDILWTEPYRIRMFPQFKTMLRDKSATSAADKGIK